MTDLEAKTKEWLAKQGYPLEYAVANEFEANGFRTQQGAFVADASGELFREIDVIASLDHQADDRPYRLSFVVECKWSRDKPWVVFTREVCHREEPPAYAVGSLLGEATMWELLEDPVLYDLRFFERRQRTGFSGRQALTEKQDRSDLFYSTLQALSGTAVAYATVDDGERIFLNERISVHVVIPIVVVDGTLFEAFFSGSDVQIAKVSYSRVKWSGFQQRETPIFIEIVSAEYLPNYARSLRNHSAALFDRLQRTGPRVIEAIGGPEWGHMHVRPKAHPELLLPTYLRKAGYQHES